MATEASTRTNTHTQRDPYVDQEDRSQTPDPAELRSRIPGWGADLDPRDRGAVPKEKRPLHGTGASWTVPERQVPRIRVFKSTEHRELTATFGTSCPPKGFSGMLRALAYRFSEGRNAHWLTLLLADRVDVVESAVLDLLRGKPDHPIAESGLKAEWTRHGLRSRIGQHRADVRRFRNELLLAAAVGAAVWGSIRRSRRRREARNLRQEEELKRGAA